MVRVMGIEPTPQAWEAHVLPLNYTRSLAAGGYLERVFSATQILVSNGLRDHAWNAGKPIEFWQKELAASSDGLLASPRLRGYSLVVKL